MSSDQDNIAFAISADVIESCEIDIVPSTTIETKSTDITDRANTSRSMNRDCDILSLSTTETSCFDTDDLEHFEILHLNVTPNMNPIGNLSVQSSSDISIGGKTFFNGPVVIKRFVADKNNIKTMENEQYSNTSETGKVVEDNSVTKSSAETVRNSYGWLHTYLLQHRLQFTFAIITSGALMITIFVVVGQYLNNRNNFRETSTTNSMLTTPTMPTPTMPTPTMPTETIDDGDGDDDDDYEYFNRSQYGALQPINEPEPITFPVMRVFIGHTITSNCWNFETCAEMIRSIQRDHIYNNGFNDINFNFLIGGDGRAYEGCGYNARAHTISYYKTGVCISFIGNYTSTEVSEKQLSTAQQLLEDGVKLNKINPRYTVWPFDSPGLYLYNKIKSWPHWDNFLWVIIP